MLTYERLANLRALAEAATSGPWHVGHTELKTHAQPLVYVHQRSGAVCYIGTKYRGKQRKLKAASDADAAFIATANPVMVIELIDEIERLYKEMDWLINRYDQQVETATQQYDDIRNKIYTAISKPVCERCQSRTDWHPTDCEKNKCHDLYEQETNNVLSVVHKATMEAAMACVVDEYLTKSINITIDYRGLMDRASANGIHLSEKEAVSLMNEWGYDLTYRISNFSYEMLDHLLTKIRRTN